MPDVNRFVEERAGRFQAVAEQRGVALRVSLDPQAGWADLFADREMLDKLLTNLLSNAFKFTERGSVEVSTALHEGRFRLAVKDTGVGIKQDQLPYIFDRFRQADGSESREYAGTGLGLALVKEIVKLHGGEVTVNSHYGRGSLFLVTLPLGKAHLDPASLVEAVAEETTALAEPHEMAAVHERQADRESAEMADRQAEAAFDPARPTVLYVEDNPDLRRHVRDLLDAHYNVFLAVDGRDGLVKVRRHRPDLILADQMMPHMSGRSLLRELRSDPEMRPIPVVFLTARAGAESRVESLDAGADDYLTKPFDEGELLARVRNLLRARAQERELEKKAGDLEKANEQLQKEIDERKRAERALQESNCLLEQRVAERTAELKEALEGVEKSKNRLHAENVYLRQEIKLTHNFEEIITQSKGFRKVLAGVEQVAGTAATVLILGETGTGKELVARAVHSLSARKERPLVKVNCAALPASLIESELFGHERGAFTGALGRKVGRFELADGGTVFLDEIGDLPLELQAKLLRVLQEGEFERLGGTCTLKADVRVIAATNRDLERAVERGDFREDLFYRLNVFPILCPPLRERREDIPLLVSHFVEKHSVRIGKKIEAVAPEVMEALQAYSWPGNVRELENVVERAVILSRGRELAPGDWLPRAASSNGTAVPTLAEMEREHITGVLELAGWRVRGKGGAAERLGMKPTTLEARMKNLNIARRR